MRAFGVWGPPVQFSVSPSVTTPGAHRLHARVLGCLANHRRRNPHRGGRRWIWALGLPSGQVSCPEEWKPSRVYIVQLTRRIARLNDPDFCTVA